VGSPTTPTVPSDRRWRGKGLLASLLGPSARTPAESITTEPILRCLSDQEVAMVEASEAFNASQFRRTVGAIGKSLGEPRVSVVVLSGLNPEVVLTVAWDISWYQYRVSVDSDN